MSESAMTAVPHPWLVPDWPQIPGVQALFTTRAGGVSQAPFDSLNLGDHVRDDPAAVAANRQILTAAIQRSSPGARPVFLQQVHGCDVEALNARTANGTAADACVSDQSGTVCTIMVADCLPVLLAHRSVPVVAAAHAGWRGLVGEDGVGVLETVFARFMVLVQAHQAQAAMQSGATNANAAHAAAPSPVQTAADIAADTQVWLGPCIGPTAFEVGDEVRQAFVAASAQAAECFIPGAAPGKWWANLPGLARQRLQALGLSGIYGNDGSAPWCTVTDSSRFFSHRRDAAELGSTGRMAACIWLDGVTPP